MRNAIIIILALFVIACAPKQNTASEKTEEQTTSSQSEITQQEEINTDQDNSSEVRIFRFFDDGNSLTYEYNTVNISRANIVTDTISNLKTVGIYVQNIYYEGSRLIVDLSAIMEQLMDHGSTGSLCNLNNMLYTFSTYPDVSEIKILINGIENIEGSHFGFNTIFQAKNYIVKDVPDFIFNALMYSFDSGDITFDLFEHQINELRNTLQTDTWKKVIYPLAIDYSTDGYVLLLEHIVVALLKLQNEQTLIYFFDPITNAHSDVYSASADIYNEVKKFAGRTDLKQRRSNWRDDYR